MCSYIPLISTIQTYKKEYVRHDLVAALTVAVVAIPQSMAYALIAGVNPVYGLYTAIVSTILGAVFGSSNHLVAGPTNAISLLIASGMAQYMGLSNAYELLFLMTFMVGAMQILLGLIKLGKAINYVSHAVIVGFTAGAGILIAMGQLNQILGIPIANSAQIPTLQKVVYVLGHMDKTNIWSLAMGCLTILIILSCRRINRNLPGALIGIIVPIGFIFWWALETKGVRLTGTIPTKLPPFTMVVFGLDQARQVFWGALAIAIIGLVEAISIAKSIAVMTRQKIDADQEFIGQGIANLGGSFFQCFAGSGSFTRSAVNHQSGAATRVSGILSGLIVALVLVFLATYARYIPSPSLAGVIIVIGVGMVNVKEIKHVTRSERSDAVAMWGTMVATVLMPDLDWAIYLGIAISIGLYLRKTNQVPVKILLPPGSKGGEFVEKKISAYHEPVPVLILQLEGNLYFGSAADLEAKLDSVSDQAKIFILRLKQVISIDVTSMEVIKQFIRRVQRAGSEVLVCGVHEGLGALLVKSDMLSEVKQENVFLAEKEVFASSHKALERAKELLGGAAG
jgi:SulP family sulfate permease